MSTNRTVKTRRFLSRLLPPFLLLICLMVSAWSVSLPVQGASMLPTGNPPGFVAKLRPLLVNKMQALRIPGAIIYVNDPGQGAWTTALGTGNLATREPMKVNNYMRIGSITKTFTATVILQLVDQHKLRLNDPVGKYQPEVPNGKNITIRELLNMTSGLFNYSDDKTFEQAYFFGDPYRVWQPKELLSFAFKHQPLFDPGMGWSYSNTNTILLGLIIEQLTHMPAEKAFEKYIFRPLGMRETSMPARSSTLIPEPHAQGYMYGTNFDGKGPTLNATDWNPSWTWTAGAAISTLHDLKIWAKALATGQLLSAATQKERLTFVPLAKGFGYGLGIADYGGFLGHNGQLPGYQSFMGYHPQSGAAIIVLVNLYFGSDGSSPADDLAQVIQKTLFA